MFVMGWSEKEAESRIPIIPCLPLSGDNVSEFSSIFPWWQGMPVKTMNGRTGTVYTILDSLDFFRENFSVDHLVYKKVEIPPEIPMKNSEKIVTTTAGQNLKKLKIIVKTVHKLKGVGDVISGIILEGVFRRNYALEFLPKRGAHGNSKSDQITVKNIEISMKRLPPSGIGIPGDHVLIQLEKRLERGSVPMSGDLIIVHRREGEGGGGEEGEGGEVEAGEGGEGEGGEGGREGEGGGGRVGEGGGGGGEGGEGGREGEGEGEGGRVGEGGGGGGEEKEGEEEKRRRERRRRRRERRRRTRRREGWKRTRKRRS
jgi:hypothetical protein